MDSRLEDQSEGRLEELLPHRPPMILLSRTISLDPQALESEVEISEDSEFYSNGSVPAWVGVEYMAQTVALYSGLVAEKTGGEPSIGFLLGARRYKATTDRFLNGQTLKIKANPVLVEDPLISFKARIEVDGEVIAESMISAYKPSKDLLEKLMTQNSH